MDKGKKEGKGVLRPHAEQQIYYSIGM